MCDSIYTFLIVLFIPLLISQLYRCYSYNICHLRKRFSNKHVVITGGSSGIGKYAAINATKFGAHVTIIARNIKNLKAATDEIKTHRLNETQKVNYVSLDCTNAEAVEEEINDLDNDFPIWMLVNCAGFASAKRLENTSNELIRKLIDVNLMGTINPTKTILGKMQGRKCGIIVITGSQASLMGIYGYSIYSAAKFALRGLAECLYMENKPYNITISLALPPDTDTPGYAVENEEKLAETYEISKMGGLYKPEIVAKRMLIDAANGHFFSYCGLSSFFTTNLCVGFAPATSIVESVWQFFSLPLARILAVCYRCIFKRIIQSYHVKNN